MKIRCVNFASTHCICCNQATAPCEGQFLNAPKLNLTSICHYFVNANLLIYFNSMLLGTLYDAITSKIAENIADNAKNFKKE